MSNYTNFEDAVGKLNSAYFFREFTFSSNAFKPDPTRELELADNLVWLDDLFIVYQVKERIAPAATTPEKEERWFKEQVVNKATRQIRDTVSYLRTYPQIELRNNRGHSFNVAAAQVAKTQKLVIYHPHELLPVHCLRKKHHDSRSVGVVHLISSGAYLEILDLLVTPVEIGEYLAYRDGLARKWPDVLLGVTEKALVGHYLRNLPDLKPTPEFETLVDMLLEKDPDRDWDISHMINLFPERKTTPDSSLESSYKVLRALAKLNRTGMAEFKKRFRFSHAKALADEVCLPHRFSIGDWGFVFIPLRRQDLPYRQKLLGNFTVLNKYDQKLGKCIGASFIAETEPGWCDVQWLTLDYPWIQDDKFQALLEEKYPFRPVKGKVVERYGLTGDTK